MNEEALFKKFFSPRPDDLGDHGLLGGGLGALQALQVPPDLLHHLLQLHDPRPRPGETPCCHQTSRCGQLALQERGFFFHIIRLILIKRKGYITNYFAILD